ncbi:CAP domain-containing protein [Corynebacterium sp. CNCTC7651]|uniref:CAP domain-containing protein n=1 Tax=Corynebacterium sp. CNCTC7651 TaxID=2815361 RepID=UPI001F25B2BA|nr:CAP domain-containing protein [Corynebacterium sp. CNCTC7651]UIZ92574.1 CAP domain-containing protein [Corynebacterium sp. CNCTC7651]
MNPQQLIGAIIAFLTALSALVGVPLTPGSSSPVHVVSRAEGSVSVSQQELIDATNRFRERNGLHALEPMPELNNLAQDWSERLAREGRLYHRPSFTSYYPAGWRYASENVLQNWSDANADVLVNQWATSPGHRKNMLDPTITHIGVGVADAPNGKRYATQNFARY